MPLLEADEARSQTRRVALDAYLRSHVLTGQRQFICPSAASCSRSAKRRDTDVFYPAQGHTVGAKYELTDSGRPLRILVVPMETGEPPERTPMLAGPAGPGRHVAERTAATMAAIDMGFRGRNGHMKGVTLALRLALGLGLPDSVDEPEYVELGSGQRAHLLETYSMCNMLMCSAVTRGTMTSRATAVMRKSCSPLLVEAIRCLEPTLVISQGAKLRDPLARAFGAGSTKDGQVRRVSVHGVSFVWVPLWHPSRGNWQSIGAAYLHSTAAPAILEGRRLALSGD
jgi:hypothetical protein